MLDPRTTAGVALVPILVYQVTRLILSTEYRAATRISSIGVVLE